MSASHFQRVVFALEQPPGGSWDHQVLRGLQPVLQERGLSLIVHDSFYNGTRQEPHVPFRPSDMDGLIVDGRAASESDIRSLAAAGVPMVLLGRTLPGLDVPTVVADGYQGARQAVAHLVEHGHQRVVFVSGDATTEDGRLREAGYRAAMREAGLEIDPALVIRGDFDPDVARESMLKLMAGGVPFTAVFGADDDCALGAMQALAQAGKRVPYDIAVAGFNNLPEAIAARPPLTTMRPDLHALGERAGRLLLDAIDGKQPSGILTIPVELIRRKSCGCY